MSGRGSGRRSSVPATRLGRLFGLGLAAGELVLGGVAEGVRRLAEGERLGGGEMLLAGPNVRRLAQRLARLRGAAMKLGQLLSLEGGGLLPREAAAALAVLQAGAEPMPAAQLHRVLGREYGKGWVGRFARFDEAPLAAASIGEVHRARTRDGRELALKIQYPGVARSIDADVDNVAALLRLLDVLPPGASVDALAAEAKRQLHQEADYLAEARFLARYRQLVADEPQLLVPRVHGDLTTARVLAMDYVAGTPLESLAGAPQAVRDSVGRLLERLVFRELFEFGVMQTDPNFANYLWDAGTKRVGLLDFGATVEFTPAFMARYRAITRAIVQGDRGAIRRHAAAIGYLAADATEAEARAAVEVIMLVCEPLRHHGRYDFAASDLSARVSERGFELAFRQGLLRTPPAETMFLHRKLVGAFLLLARIGARVDVRSLAAPFLRVR
jgi:predicted unusual protein kinase regulating ubiquinone biosynthesis (AarF/ABC1/UbiB family)